MARLSLNDDDARVRHWLIDQAKALGCTVKVDQMGNIFCVRPGKTNDRPPVMMGSHLDTQPTGGRYDGILGVTAGLEVLRTLHDNDYQTEGPIGVVNWTKFVPPFPFPSLPFPSLPLKVHGLTKRW
jgi:acetylornithine deacetylase/succinyl-diaminopimelate desuccinylase-like protein